MEREQNNLVSIGEAFGGLDRPVKTIRESAPQARHHFTLSDQVDQLAEASEEDPDLGFMARLMALCSLPRTNPGDRLQYICPPSTAPIQLGMIAPESTTSSPSATSRACCWPGSQPKRYVPKAASLSWAARSPSSCGKLGI